MPTYLLSYCPGDRAAAERLQLQLVRAFGPNTVYRRSTGSAPAAKASRAQVEFLRPRLQRLIVRGATPAPILAYAAALGGSPDFASALDALCECRAMLVAIGPKWEFAPAGALDLVRQEVILAASIGVPIAVVLLGRNRVPTADALPQFSGSRTFRLLAESSASIRDPGDDPIRALDVVLHRVRPTDDATDEIVFDPGATEGFESPVLDESGLYGGAAATDEGTSTTAVAPGEPGSDIVATYFEIPSAAHNASEPAVDWAEGSEEFRTLASEEPAALDAEPEDEPPPAASPTRSRRTDDGDRAPTLKSAHPPAKSGSGVIGALLGRLFGSRAAPPEPRFPAAVRDTSPTAAEDPVDCTVFAPPEVAVGASLLVQVFAHLPERTEEAARKAAAYDAKATERGAVSLAVEVARGERLDFHLTLLGLGIEEPTTSLVWDGRTAAATFAVHVPADHPTGSVIGTVFVSRGGAPLGSVKFLLDVARRAKAAEPRPRGVRATHYRRAFVSYASADRAEVVKRVQMLRVTRVKVFQDVLSLEPGQRWERELYRKIDECDLFLLFWSRAAEQSEWVRKEVQYALARRGDDDTPPPDIIPVILEGPPPPAPPEELAHLHFDDFYTYFRKG